RAAAAGDSVRAASAPYQSGQDSPVPHRVKVPAMSASAADQPRRLVDMEFRPGELPAAEPSARLDAGQGRGEGRDLLDGEKRTSLAAWLALGASAVILLLV